MPQNTSLDYIGSSSVTSKIKKLKYKSGCAEFQGAKDENNKFAFKFYEVASTCASDRTCIVYFVQYVTTFHVRGID